MPLDYKSAGVDISAGDHAVGMIKKSVEKTFTKDVLTKIGTFGALYDLKSIATGYRHPVLVQSIDGVGTKMMVARMMNRFDTIGIDVVSATANDIVVMGARPLTLLDYIAQDRLKPEVVSTIVEGIATACLDCGISLVGGEMAEMPGIYHAGEHDLVGVVTGVVEKDKVIDGASIKVGDEVVGLASSGLHTNGYSLARALLFKEAGFNVMDLLPGSSKNETIGEVLLTPHLNYTNPVRSLLEQGLTIKGMAHITGGGLLGNIPRCLPHGCSVKLHLGSWPIPPVFTLLQSIGGLQQQELYRTFNMGIGLVLIGVQGLYEQVRDGLQGIWGHTVHKIGNVVPGQRHVLLVNKQCFCW